MFPQLIEHTSVARSVNADKYFRFHYDNDYFTKTDEYYSQGISLEYVNPSLQKNPLNRLLWKPFKAHTKYGIVFNLFGYTPSSIESDVILYGDRPFDANLSLKTFLIQVDEKKKQQFSAAFSLGVMGPPAFGKEIQTNIHRWLKNPLPHGWQYQVSRDVILNYQLKYEKQLASAGNNLLLNATAEARFGTLDDKLNAGFNFMAGKFNGRFKQLSSREQKTEYYLFGQARVNAIAYDASLQGGLFNHSSPYTISASDISRFTFQADAGIILNFRKLYLAYTQSILTKEFRTGRFHRWGGVTIGFGL